MERSRTPYEDFLKDGSNRGRQVRNLMEKRKGKGAGSAIRSWERGTKEHVPVPICPNLSRVSTSLALADTRVPQAASTTAADASGCVTYTPTPGSVISTEYHPALYVVLTTTVLRCCAHLCGLPLSLGVFGSRKCAEVCFWFKLSQEPATRGREAPSLS